MYAFKWVLKAVFHVMPSKVGMKLVRLRWPNLSKPAVKQASSAITVICGKAFNRSCLVSNMFCTTTEVSSA